ncbi:MAG: nucleoside deaminase [Spirochaetia bacterium]|nr:nucleoside deaminase [Spirochaetia bacterium]
MIKRLKDIKEVSEYLFKLAEHAAKKNEVPVASLVCQLKPGNQKETFKDLMDSFLNGESLQKINITGRGINQIIKKKDPTAHSELIAIRKACRKARSERLSDSFLITTLEPCSMCGGAAVLSRLDAVIYFAPSLSGPGIKSLLEKNPRESHAFNHYPEIYHLKEYEKRASDILRSFFRFRRI